MSEFLDGQDAIIDEIKALATLNKFSVYDGALPTGDQLKATNGRYWPYAVYSLGGKSPVAEPDRGITSSADDLKHTSLVFFCVGNDPTTVRRLKDILRTKFEGYTLGIGWGQMTEVLSGDYGISKPDPDLIPLRYGEPLIFTLSTDV